MKHALLALLLVVGHARAGNLVPDASFAGPFDSPTSWKRTYNGPGESWYKGNAALVEVVAESGRPAVLRLNVATQFLADNPGVKVESAPIPFDPKAVYVFSAEARSGGPHARIMLEGYRRKKGAAASVPPGRDDLRLVYRFPILTFRPGDSTEVASPPGTWTVASMRVPSESLTPMGRRALESVEYVVVRVVAIAGTSGELRVANIRFEKQETPPSPAATPPKTP